MSKKKILVTGAAGFIGSHLVDALIARGEKVRCLVRRQDDLQFLPQDKVEIFYGDITNKNSLLPAVHSVQTIYHLAARTDFEGKTWKEYLEPNVLGTQNLIDLAIAEKVQRFIFFSSIRVVGLRDSKTPVNEMAPYQPLNFYDRSKYEAEKRLLSAHKEVKLPVVIIRPTSVYGPRDRGTYYSFFKAIAQGKFFLIGKGDNLVSFVHVKNVVNAAILAEERKEAVGKIYFINDEHPYTMRELAVTIAEAFEKKPPNFYLPVSLGYLAGYVGNLIKMLGMKFPLTSERVKNLTISYVFDISRAKKELGYNPKVALNEGVKQTTGWYKEHGWI